MSHDSQDIHLAFVIANKGNEPELVAADIKHANRLAAGNPYLVGLTEGCVSVGEKFIPALKPSGRVRY